MAARDVVIDAYAMVVVLKADVAVWHTHCEKLERMLAALQEAHGVATPVHECPARDPKDEQEHKRLKACFQYQKRGETKTASLGSIWAKDEDADAVSELPTVPMYSPSNTFGSRTANGFYRTGPARFAASFR